MQSLTKSKVTKDQINKAAKKVLGKNLVEYKELNEGYYNISFLVVLDDGIEVVLKIAPPKNVDVLTYENDIITTELKFIELVGEKTDIKIPKVLGSDFSCEIINAPYYFMSKIEGITLNNVKDVTPEMRKQVNEVIAEYIAKLHNIKGDTFGYITMKESCAGKGCFDSILISVEALYNDALRKNADMPFSIDEIKDLLNKTRLAFDEITTPVLTHFDLWDGNIFATKEDDKISIEGIIDFERGFYACPAVDFCQVHIDFKEDKYFLEAYNKFADKKVEWTNNLKVRILTFKLYLFLIMRVECFYRDIDGSFEEQKQWVSKDIITIFNDLKNCVNK